MQLRNISIPLSSKPAVHLWKQCICYSVCIPIKTAQKHLVRLSAEEIQSRMCRHMACEKHYSILAQLKLIKTTELHECCTDWCNDISQKTGNHDDFSEAVMVRPSGGCGVMPNLK